MPNLSSFTAFFPGRTSVVQVPLQPSDATVRVYRVRGTNPLSRNLTLRKPVRHASNRLEFTECRRSITLEFKQHICPVLRGLYARPNVPNYREAPYRSVANPWQTSKCRIMINAMLYETGSCPFATTPSEKLQRCNSRSEGQQRDLASSKGRLVVRNLTTEL